MPKNPFDDVVLLGRADRGDDFHGLLARGAKAGVFEPHLGNELGPTAASAANELGALFLR
jgi:hypothetical protein